MWNGQPLLLNATALAENGIVTVTLGHYPPERLRNVTMYIAVLMAESGFVASWNNSIGVRMVELHEAKKIFEGQCKRSVFLTSRYHLCGKTKGWKSDVVSMTLSPWQPQTQQFSFDVLRLDGDRHFREDVRGGSVHITMAEPGAPAVWAVAQQGCELNLVGGEISADQDQLDVYSASFEAMLAFVHSPPAICTYIFSNCTNLSALIGQDPESYSHGVNRTRQEEFKLEQALDNNHREDKLTSPQLAQVLHCARKAGREMDWVRGQLSPLSIDEDMPPRQSEYVWILGNQHLFPGSIEILGNTLKLEDLFKTVAPKHSEVDEKLVRDVCTFLLDPTHKKPEAETFDANIMRQAMVAAFGANRGEAVRLAGKHCFNSSDPILRDGFKELAKLIWKALTSSSASARLSMLNVSLHFLDGALASKMLEHSTTSNCVGCADVLQELIQTGHPGPPLVFSRLHLDFGANLLSLAAIKSTRPWLCTRELVISTPSFQRFHGAETLLEQMKLCEESPLASLRTPEMLPIDAHDFSTLGPGLPKKVRFSVGATASTKASQNFSVRSKAPNLDILEEINVNFKDSAGLMQVCKEISRARPAMLKYVYFPMGKIGCRYKDCRDRIKIQLLQPAMKDMAEMVVALPNLERFGCTNGDISKDGLEEFSRVLTPKASTLKLKSIDLSRTNLEGAAEDLGKALAMVPTLVQVGLGHNFMADVAYAGFLRPFVSREGSSLKRIDVRRSGFGDGAAEVLAELMQKQGLESIDVGFTNVTDKGLSALGRALKVGECSLKEVFAEEVGTDTGVTALLMGLTRCPDLETASFYSTPLQEKTVEMAMKNVKNGDVWPKLKHLAVKYRDRDYDLKSEDPLATAS